MNVKLLTKHYLELLSLKLGCTGSPEPTLVKMPHCWKSVQLYSNFREEKYCLYTIPIGIVFLFFWSASSLLVDAWHQNSYFDDKNVLPLWLITLPLKRQYDNFCYFRKNKGMIFHENRLSADDSL